MAWCTSKFVFFFSVYSGVVFPPLNPEYCTMYTVLYCIVQNNPAAPQEHCERCRFRRGGGPVSHNTLLNSAHVFCTMCTQLFIQVIILKSSVSVYCWCGFLNPCLVVKLAFSFNIKNITFRLTFLFKPGTNESISTKILFLFHLCFSSTSEALGMLQHNIE